jgi:type IV pilus assembly protein PilM
MAPVSGSPFDMTDDDVRAAPAPAASPFDHGAEPAIPPAAASPFDTSDPFAAAVASSPSASSPAAGLPASVPGDDPSIRRRREIFDALLPVLGEFAGEVRRSIDYFRSRYPNDTLDQIILCGGSARIPNLDQFLQSDLGVTTVVANPFAGVNVSSRQISSERLQEIAPAFAVAVGLATRDALLGSDKK